MAAPPLTKRTVHASRIETTYGSDPTVDITSYAMLVNSDAGITPKKEVVERTGQRSTLSPLRAIPGMATGAFDCDAEFKTSGTAADGGATDVCNLYPLLLACGLDATRTAETGTDNDGFICYQPRSLAAEATPINSCSIEQWIGMETATSSLHRQLRGAVGTCGFSLEAGSIPKVNFSMQGLYTKPADDAGTNWTTDAGYDTNLPQKIQSLACTFDTYAGLTVRSFGFELNNVITGRPDINSSGSMAGYFITDRAPTFNMVVEALLAATKDMWDAVDTGATLAVTAIVSNSSVQDRIYFSLPTCTVSDVTPGNDGGIATYTITGKMYGDDDEIRIVQGAGTSAGATNDI